MGESDDQRSDILGRLKCCGESLRHLGLLASLCSERFDGGGDHARFGRCGIDRIDGDTEGCEVTAYDISQSEDSPFARAVGGLVRDPYESCAGNQIDDAAVTRGLHMRRRRSQAMEGSVQMASYDTIKELGIVVENRGGC